MKPRYRVGLRELCGWAGLVAAGALAAPAGAQGVRAFPGAEGFGAHARGGRGGTVYRVTHLGDSGPGSFRDAVSQPNRYVVFTVGGVIRLQSRVTVASNLTIAGQTAPGDGITLYGNGLSFSNANETVVRYLRIRMGVVGDSGADAVTIAQGSTMIFDHVSVSWGRDETFSVTGTAANITIQDSIVAQGLHPHSAGGLMETGGAVSVVRCLYVDNTTRNPKVKGVHEFVNNVVYNWGSGGAYILGDSAGQSFANIIENYFIDGPSTAIAPFTRGNLNFHVYASNNHHDADRDGLLDGAVVPQSGYTVVDWRTEPFPYPTLRALPAAQAYAWVVAHAGASRVRDAVDRRLVDEVLSLGSLGQIVSSENDPPMAGPGPVAGGAAPLDSDADGMPDAWEAAVGLDPAVADHNGDPDGDGYTHLEDYLNALVPGGLQTAAIEGISEDTGLSGSDAVTMDETLTLRGTGPPGGSVSVRRLGLGTAGTAAVDAAGRWRLDLAPLAEGAHAFAAIATGAAGAGPPTPALVVTVDLTAPPAPVVTSVVLADQLSVNGTAEPGGEVEVVLVGAGSVGRTVADGGGLWTLVYAGPPLAPGVHTLAALAVDRAGNAGPASDGYAVDTRITPPQVLAVSDDTGVSATDRLTSDRTLLLRGTAPGGATVTVTRGGSGTLGTTAADAEGFWTFDHTGTELPAGVHAFWATATDGSGNSSPAGAPVPVTIDTTAPAVASVQRHDPLTAATTASTVTFRVAFAEAVVGVDLADFVLTTSGATAATLAAALPRSETVVDVLVTGLAGEGTLRLDLRASGTGIADLAGNGIGGGFTAGQVYTVRAAGSGVWVVPESGGQWSDPAQWQEQHVAEGASATADFASLDVTEDVAVHLDAPRTIGHLVFGDADVATAAGWHLGAAGTPAPALTLAAGAGSPTLTVNALGGAAAATIDAVLEGSAGLAKAGAGTLVLTRANTVAGPLTVGRGTLRLGPGGSLAATSLTVAGNISELNVAGGTFSASGLATLTPRNSAIVVDAGSARFDGGVTCTNTRDAIFRVRGGTVSALRVDFPRTSDATINFGSGLLIQGGATTIGSIGLGTANSWGVMSVEAGSLTVAGPVTVGHQVTAGRGGAFRVTGGTLDVADTAQGIVMSRNPGTNPNNVSHGSFLGGTSTVGRITLGFDATVTAGAANLTVNGGALYLGAGGLVKNGTGGFAANVALAGGVLGAAAAWSSDVDMTLPAGSTIALAAADPAGAAHDVTLRGVLSGAGGLTKAGAGALVLTGSSTFTGPVAVNAGTLQVDGALAAGEPVTVGSGAALAGGGSLARTIVLNEGTVAPGGAAAGSSLSAAAMAWNAGRLAVDLASGRRLALGGALTKGGPGPYVVSLSASAPLPVGTAYTLATYASTDFLAGDLIDSGPGGHRGVFLVGPAALQFLVTGAGPSAQYTHWAYLRLPEGQRGAADDPDADGLPNLLEFVLDLDPLQPGGDGTRAVTVAEGGETYPAITYRRLQDRGGVVVEVLASPSLAFGARLDTLEVSAEPQGDGTELVVVRSAVPLSQHPRQFLRLAVTLP